jgi:tetrahydromethanopterin S-methyltransferase subunit E
MNLSIFTPLEVIHPALMVGWPRLWRGLLTGLTNEKFGWIFVIGQIIIIYIVFIFIQKRVESRRKR